MLRTIIQRHHHQVLLPARNCFKNVHIYNHQTFNPNSISYLSQSNSKHLLSKFFSTSTSNHVSMMGSGPYDDKNTHFMLKPKIHSIASDELRARSGENHPYWDNPEKTPIYLPQDLVVKELHHEPKTRRDKIALFGLRVVKRIMNMLSNYKGAGQMTKTNWLNRCIFLETLAGCHGMVGSMVRHLKSLRSMKRDYGWISTLLEESENQRMHLLICLQMFHKKATLFYRLKLTLGQAIFTNVYFICYFLSPVSCHRFVGYLEEETIDTYTKLLSDLQTSPQLKKWASEPASVMAKDYYKLGKDATIYHVIECIRADEANHRDVNHEFASDPIIDAESIFTIDLKTKINKK